MSGRALERRAAKLSERVHQAMSRPPPLARDGSSRLATSISLTRRRSCSIACSRAASDRAHVVFDAQIVPPNGRGEPLFRAWGDARLLPLRARGLPEDFGTRWAGRSSGSLPHDRAGSLGQTRLPEWAGREEGLVERGTTRARRMRRRNGYPYALVGGRGAVSGARPRQFLRRFRLSGDEPLAFRAGKAISRFTVAECAAKFASVVTRIRGREREK